MTPFNTRNKMPIESFQDFEEVASEIYGSFLEGMSQEKGHLRPVEEGDVADESWTFIYTDKGMMLAERMKKRLLKVGEAHFPDEDITIEHSLYQEY